MTRQRRAQVGRRSVGSDRHRPMPRTRNRQYNVAAPDSIAVRVATLAAPPDVRALCRGDGRDGR